MDVFLLLFRAAFFLLRRNNLLALNSEDVKARNMDVFIVVVGCCRPQEKDYGGCGFALSRDGKDQLASLSDCLYKKKKK